MPKSRTPSATTQRLVELTAQSSTPAWRSVATRSAISAKMRGVHKFLDVLGGGGAQFLVAQAGIDLHHLAADLHFAHLAGTVGAVAGIDPVAGGAGDQPLLERPGHEPIACVAAP